MLYLGLNYPRKVGQIAIHNFFTPLRIENFTIYDRKNNNINEIFLGFFN